MRKSIERIIEEKLKLEELVVEILSDAAYAESFISKPNNNRCPSMYKLLDFIRERKDIGFYDRPKLILRATPRQMTRYSLALDILCEVETDKTAAEIPSTVNGTLTEITASEGDTIPVGGKIATVE